MQKNGTLKCLYAVYISRVKMDLFDPDFYENDLDLDFYPQMNQSVRNPNELWVGKIFKI